MAMQSIHGIEEKELVYRIMNGDQKAFELLFHFYYPGLVVYSRQFTADHSEAEEIVQDFFVRLWQKRQQLIPSDSLKSFVFSSVKNSSLNFLKHKKIEEKYIKEMSELSSHHLMYEPDLYITSELQAKIKNGINNLPEKCREIFIMSRVRGIKNETIASELNISKRTVETQITKALKVLRVVLKEYIGILLLFTISIFPVI